MREFLINFRGYSPENIVVMMRRHNVAKHLYPSRTNTLRLIDLLVKRTSQHDQIFFYYTGIGDVTYRHHSESDNKDEAILTYTGKHIIDNVLKARLVDPLPQDAKLFALWDCDHSPTILDLEHYKCNELWRVPFKVLSGLGGKTQSPGEYFYLSVHYHLNVRCAGDRLSASLLKHSSKVRSSIKDDSQTRFGALITDSVGSAPRSSSPECYLPVCTLDCPMTLLEERVEAHVVSLSACRDDEIVHDDSTTGETFTKFFIDYLERNPEASYHDLLSYTQHKVDGLTRRRTRAMAVTRENLRSGHHDQSDDESAFGSQRPSYSSRYRLDMLEIVDL
ncbi:hypothetical protein DFH29DRAFT_953093 [Suillus ampliporus]|nr:hypothetical protein DFH29DRAFT_953093 [Suillus ampliporus]